MSGSAEYNISVEVSTLVEPCPTSDDDSCYIADPECPQSAGVEDDSSLTECNVTANVTRGDGSNQTSSSRRTLLLEEKVDNDRGDIGNDISPEERDHSPWSVGVLEDIQEASANGWTTLDLSRRQLRQIPHCMLTLHNLLYLYLADNQLDTLPDNFFRQFPQIQWLDLRWNRLTHLPCRGLEKLQGLRCLLLEGNFIEQLPLELGLISTLHGLNIQDNPLQFPPNAVVAKGTREILEYLHEEYLLWKQEGDFSHDNVTAQSNMHSVNIVDGTNAGQYETCFQTDLQESTLSDAVPETDALHQAQKQSLDLKFLKPSFKKPTSLSPSKKIAKRVVEDYQKLTMRRNNMQIERTLQMRKDQESLKRFREEIRERQVFCLESKNEIPDIASDAPFGVHANLMKMMSRIDINKKEEVFRPLRKIMPPELKKQISKEKTEKILELEKKIKSHYFRMYERRKNPKRSIAEEVAATKEDLDIAKRLQNELEEQRKNLEYRFKAFTGEMSTVSI